MLACPTCHHEHHEPGSCPWCSCSSTGPTTTTGTRRAAFVRAMREAPRRRALVFAALVRRGAVGATAEELEVDTGLSGNTVRPRLVELRAEGRILVAPRTRPTRSGARAMVYVVTPEALP